MSTEMVSGLFDETRLQDYEELFREYYRFVYRTAYGITGRTEDAEDVLQTVFLKLLRRRSPEVQKNPRGYLYRASVNASLDILHTRQRHVLTDNLDIFEPPPGVVDTNSEEVARRQLSDAMAQLKPRTVEILILRYEHDYSDAEIARILGTSRGVIAVTLYRARAHLKKLLATSKDK